MRGSAPRRSIAQVARDHGVGIKEVSRAARQVLDLPANKLRDPAYVLTAHQVRLVDDVLRRSNGSSDHSLTGRSSPGSSRPNGGQRNGDANGGQRRLSTDPAADGEASAEGAVQARSDLTTATGRSDVLIRSDCAVPAEQLRFGALTYPLWAHVEVNEEVARVEHLRRRLGVAYKHLAATGRTPVIKGCADPENRGWRRSPLGGHGGNHYYLWWAPSRGRHTDHLGLAAGQVVVRAVRHHDDHRPLKAGATDDLMYLEVPELEDDAYAGRPWTTEQERFVLAEHPVRVLVGRPGAGKTSALWRAVEARGNQTVLYLTWSAALSASALAHLRCFAPVDVEVVAQPFLRLLGALCGEDVEQRTLAASRDEFSRAVDRLSPSALGPWQRRPDALHDEMRAYLLGHALPPHALPPHALPDDGVSTGPARLDDRSYRTLRGGTDGIGRQAADHVLKVSDILEPGTFGRLHPELWAAGRAVRRLREGILPDGYQNIDRIVVDELQDLTLSELEVICELTLAIAAAREDRVAPSLLLAGDDGQTVRPSGFAWGPVKDLLTDRICPPEEFHLEENLRCPQRISEVVQRAAGLYAPLPKDARPTKQSGGHSRHAVAAHVLYTEVDEHDDVATLLADLTDIDGLVLLTVDEQAPDWVPADLRDDVLTPLEAKGLEYQSVCVLDVGAVVDQSSGSDDLHDDVLARAQQRTAVDRLRVTLSRATETLAFIDHTPSGPQRQASLRLLGEPALFRVEELAEHFADADLPIEQRIQARTAEARALAEERPTRAWRRAHQAMRLLGDPQLPNGVSDADVRHAALSTMLSLVVRRLTVAESQAISSEECLAAADEALAAIDQPTARQGFDHLQRWLADDHEHIVRLLACAVALPEHTWLTDVFVVHANRARDHLAEASQSPRVAAAFADDVESWLTVLSGFAEVADTARQLRIQATETLLADRQVDEADRVRSRIDPELPGLTGRIREAQKRFEEAAEAYERASESLAALRCWRQVGRFDRALVHATGSERDDLAWLATVQQHWQDRPAGLDARLTTAEATELRQLTREPARANAGGRRQRVGQAQR